MYALRSAVAVVTSFLVARVFTLPEAYWAAVTTLIVTQSAPGTSASVAGRRFLGTALGAALAALLGFCMRPNIWTCGVGVFFLGLICAAIGRAHRKLHEQFDRTTYRFAGIALTIILLIPRAAPIWVAALHRFLEVSIGIVGALVLTFLWAEAAGVGSRK
jgi:uncharacterized membrane protein YccC